ncbi:hypothetical protein B0H13DRAFT_2655645 [Mycena leptocephala]|nr:hypothetical protein B0H13DRAFT_2655645 [Mycena leptocephala]
MGPDAESRSKHTPADQEYLDSLPARQLMDFRNFLFTPTYISLNAAKFLDHEWVDIGELWKYLQHTAKNPGPSAPVPVKIEVTPLSMAPVRATVIKAEPQAISVPVQASVDIKMGALNEDGREVFELLSDSEPDADNPDSDLEVINALQRTSRSSSAAPLTDADCFTDQDEGTLVSGSSNSADADDITDDDSDSGEPVATEYIREGWEWDSATPTIDDASDLEDSDTMWQDNGTSLVRTGKFRITQKLTVERIEYRVGPAVIYPIHRTPTAIVVDLTNGIYRLRDPTTKELYTLNTIIMNADNDSWDWLGGARSGAKVMFAPGEKATDCQRIRYRCKGSSRGHQYFVGCSGWTPNFKQGPRTHSIPDNVDENLLANGLAGRPLSDDSTKDTRPCSGLIHPHTGLRKKTCPHAHIVNGMQVQGKIRNYPCNALRTIYVPTNPSILKVLVVHNNTGHNHPMPTLTKASFGHKDTYLGLIEANGVLGATVAKIDNAPSTKQLLKGKAPAAHAAPLHNKCIKQDLLRTAKLEKYPNSLGVDAIRPIYHEELTKPLPERYIHSYIETKKGEIIIVTFVPYLLKLLDDPGVTSFDGDTTYKGIEGKLNEWELTIFAKVVQPASLLRAYINGASTDFFEQLFDELQRVKLMVTGKPIPLKRFVRGGNLLVTNVDMDGAQVLGLCRSVMKYNDPEYSGIPNDIPPEKIASELIKLCWRHRKEPIHDFKSPVSPEQLARIKDVFYIDSLAEFSSFIYGLGVKKITGDRRKVDKNVAEEIQMSLKTGILSNPNNELSHRMARNNQRQSAAARRAREAHEKAAKAPSVDPAFFDFDFDSLLASLETCPSIFAQDTSNTGNQFTTYDRTFDPAVFGLPGGDFNALMPSNSSAPTTDPLDEFMTMYGFSESDGAACSFVSGAPFNNELPLLPPPPPESPPAPSPTVEHPSESVPRSRCARKEVDEANIIYSTRSRAPTARKRFADEELSDRPTKQRRASKVL